MRQVSTGGATGRHRVPPPSPSIVFLTPEQSGRHATVPVPSNVRKHRAPRAQSGSAVAVRTHRAHHAPSATAVSVRKHRARHKPPPAHIIVQRSVVCLVVATAITGALFVAGNIGKAGDGGARAFVLRPEALVDSRVLADADSQLHDSGSVPGSEASVDGLSSASESGTGHGDSFPASGLAADGIPETALAAYQNAADREAALNPACGIVWPLLAAIGRVESDHGRFNGAVLHSDGLSTPPVIGIPLDGNGTARIEDTDNGALDGDPYLDRAVGPMQFIPSTWAGWGVDANSDGLKDPFNVFDAAAAAADYLCAAGRDLTTTKGQVAAILSYNWSWDYVNMVMGLERVYASGVVGITVPVLPTSPGQGRPAEDPELPPVDPGKPRGTEGGPTPSPTSSNSTPRPSPTRSNPASSSGSSQPSSPGTSSSNQQSSSPSSSQPDSNTPSSSDPGTPSASDPGTPPSTDSTDPTCSSDSPDQSASPSCAEPSQSGT